MSRASSQYPLVAEEILVGGDTLTSAGTYDLCTLPAGAIVVSAWYEVVEAFTGTGTVAIQVDDGTTQTAITAANNGDSTGTTASSTGVPLATFTVPHTLQAVVATAALTDGKAKVYVQYFIEGRAHEAG